MKFNKIYIYIYIYTRFEGSLRFASILVLRPRAPKQSVDEWLLQAPDDHERGRGHHPRTGRKQALVSENARRRGEAIVTDVGVRGDGDYEGGRGHGGEEAMALARAG